MSLLRLCLVWCCTLLLAGCVEETPGDQPGDGEIPDAGPILDVAPPDGAVEPDARPQGVQYDFCAQGFFKLPIDTPDQAAFGVSVWGTRVAYARLESSGDQTLEAYLLDMESCVEYQLTQGAKATSVYLRESELVYADGRLSSTTSDYYCSDIYRFNLDTWQEERLTEDPHCDWEPRTDGKFLLYKKAVAGEPNSPNRLRLWDMDQGGEEIILAEAGSQPGYYDIGDQVVVWSAYTQDPSSVGKDVFYYDLATQTPVHIDSTYERYQYNVFTSGEYLTWGGSDVWLLSPLHLVLYHIPTGEERVLVENDESVAQGCIHGNLVAYLTSKYMLAPVGPMPADIEIYDIETEVTRRVTAWESNLAVAQVFFPYMLMSYNVDYHQYEYYIANLEQLGIVDEMGHVIEGEGVVEPPGG